MHGASSRRDLGAFLDSIYVALYERLDVAFPEFGWKRRSRSWIASTWPNDFPQEAAHKRGDRLEVYEDAPWGVKCHGYGFTRFLNYLHQGQTPKGVDFWRCARELARRANIPVPADLAGGARDEDVEHVSKGDVRRTVLALVIEACVKHLWSSDGQAARDYLICERGLTEEQIRGLELGLYPTIPILHETLKAADIAHEDASATSVLWPKLENYIIFPWRDDRAAPLTLYGRWPRKTPPEKRLLDAWRRDRDAELESWEQKKAETGVERAWVEPTLPKTIALPGANTKASPLYLDRTLKAQHDEVLVVEGVMDAALLQARGETRVIASVAAQLNAEQLATLVRRKIKRAYVCGDPDGGGDRGNTHNVHSLAHHGIDAWVVPRLPDGLDPDEYVIREGLDAWRALVSRSEPGAVYLARVALGAVSPTSPVSLRRAGVERVADAVEDVLVGPWAEATRGDVVRLAAERTGWSVEEVAATLAHLWEHSASRPGGTHGNASSSGSSGKNGTTTNGMAKPSMSGPHSEPARDLRLDRVREVVAALPTSDAAHRWLGAASSRAGVADRVREILAEGARAAFDGGVVAEKACDRVGRGEVDEAQAARIRRALVALAHAPEPGKAITAVEILSLTRVTAGDGRGASFRIIVATPAGAATLTLGSGRELNSYEAVRDAATDAGLALPFLGKNANETWNSLVARALEHEKVEEPPSEIDPGDAIDETIERILRDTPRADTGETVEDELEAGKVVEAAGRLLIRASVVMRGVRRALPDDKVEREDVVGAAERLGYIDRPVVASRRRGRGVWSFPVGAAAPSAAGAKSAPSATSPGPAPEPTLFPGAAP